jgi:hypothetical protein
MKLMLGLCGAKDKLAQIPWWILLLDNHKCRCAHASGMIWFILKWQSDQLSLNRGHYLKRHKITKSSACLLLTDYYSSFYAKLQMSVYAKGVSVLMPGQDVPTFIAHPVPPPAAAPCPCQPEKVSWPSHHHYPFPYPSPTSSSNTGTEPS